MLVVLGPLLCVLAGCSGSLTGDGRCEIAEPSTATLSKTEETLGDRDARVAELRAAVERRPEAVRPHLQYVKAMLRMGRRTQARQFYEGRAARPGATDAERTVAERLRTNGASSALRRVYVAAAERNPSSPWWRLAQAEVEIAEADAWNRKRLDASDRGDPRDERQAYRQAVGAVRRAQRALTLAAEIEPERAEVHLYRGFLRAVEGDMHASAPAQSAAYRAALSAFATAARLDASLVEAWNGLGETRFRTGDTGGSLAAYLHAARLAPADAQLRISLGVVLHELDRLDEAAVQYRQAARLAPHDADPLLRLGDVRADARHWDRAVAAYREALECDPDALEAYVKMGTVLEHRGRRAEARAVFERYVAQGGERSAVVERRIERLVRLETR